MARLENTRQVILLPPCPLSLAHSSNNASSRSSFSSYCSASAFSRSWHAWQPSCVHPSATEAPHSATMHRPVQPRTSEPSLAAHDGQCVNRSRLVPTGPCDAYAPQPPLHLCSATALWPGRHDLHQRRWPMSGWPYRRWPRPHDSHGHGTGTAVGWLASAQEEHHMRARWLPFLSSTSGVLCVGPLAPQSRHLTS